MMRMRISDEIDGRISTFLYYLRVYLDGQQTRLQKIIKKFKGES